MSERFPVLTEDGSRLDWLKAQYRVDVILKGQKAVIKHQIHDAPELQLLLDEGDARWVTEVRCPRTLLSRQHDSALPEQVVTWNDDTIFGETYLTPGLVLKRDTQLGTSQLNPIVWPENSSVKVPSGWWLARGEMRSVTPLAASLVRFRRDPDGHLGQGQMSVTEDFDGTTPYFRIDMAEDIYASRREVRDVQIAGLIAACALLPRSSLREGGENDDIPLASQLRDRFEAAKIANWDDDDFDPARAATVLEEFRIPAENDEE